MTEFAGRDDAQPLPLVEFVPTGDPRVDGALERVADLDILPLDEHPEVFDDIHRRLQAALSDTLSDSPGAQ